MSSYREDTELAVALAALRPAPRPEFAAELDARVAEGFPRRGGAGSAIGRRVAAIRATPPRRLLLPVGGVAVAAVVLATAVVATSEHGPAAPQNRHLTAPSAPVGTIDGGSGETSGDTVGTAVAPSSSSARSGAETSAGGESEESAIGRQAGPYAAHAAGRDVERSASITIGAAPSEVRSDSARVFEAVHAANGIVLHSTIHDGSRGDAAADFELLIPAARLDDALAAFSGIGEVRSRHESTGDITAPTVGAQERLQDSRARIESLLTEVAGATSEPERASAEVELRTERRRAAGLRSQLSGLQRRANLAHVSLRIETGEPAAQGGAGGGWGIGDGFDDATRILAIAAGLAIIGLAILGPIALIVLLVWLAQRGWLHASRRHALRRA